MLYSHNIENDKLSLFKVFVSRAKGGEQNYKKLVDDVIIDAHLFTIKKKHLYQLDKDTITIVLALANGDTDYFAQISTNPNIYDNPVYDKILELLSKKRSPSPLH